MPFSSLVSASTAGGHRQSRALPLGGAGRGLLSVIIPTYQPGAYIWECLDSLYRQTLDSSDFEVIIVLNGPEEPYLQQLQQGVATRYEGLNCQVLYTEEKGVSNARNKGLDACRGDYVCFIDDDDWVSDTYLATLLQQAAEDIVVVSNVTDYDEANDRLQDDYLTKAFNTLGAGQHVSLFRGRSFLSSSCCKIIPRKMIGQRRFNTSFAIGEDALFMATISNRMEAITLSAPDAIYYRRLRPLSASRRKRTRWQIFRNSMRLSLNYMRLGLSDIRHYSHPLLASRIVAVMMWVVKG
ncbi:MAG: glycosyltransferase [Bacteroidaceae bacterium]|nr:glycosyltransferase [Bacteroidaceae bacterium]